MRLETVALKIGNAWYLILREVRIACFRMQVTDIEFLSNAHTKNLSQVNSKTIFKF